MDFTNVAPGLGELNENQDDDINHGLLVYNQKNILLKQCHEKKYLIDLLYDSLSLWEENIGKNYWIEEYF